MQLTKGITPCLPHEMLSKNMCLGYIYVLTIHHARDLKRHFLSLHRDATQSEAVLHHYDVPNFALSSQFLRFHRAQAWVEVWLGEIFSERQ
uniref:Uncharacterized protein n=1 Tax=Salix viminalis TaxID=40686 RepID=A0A6N2K3M5_SALVM